MAQATDELKTFFDSTIISEETTKRTLGKAYSKVSPEALLDTSHKLLKVSRVKKSPMIEILWSLSTSTILPI